MDLGRKKDFLISFWIFFFPRWLSLSSPWACLKFGDFFRYFQSGFDLLLVLQIGLSVFWLSFTQLITLITEKKAGKIFKCVEERGYDLKHKLFLKLFLLWLALQHELVLKKWLVWHQGSCADVHFSCAMHSWVTPEDRRSGWDNKILLTVYLLCRFMITIKKKYSERSLLIKK